MRKVSLLPAVFESRSDLDRLMAMSDRLFSRYASGPITAQTAAPLDFYEVPNGFYLEWELPGVGPEDIQLSLDGQALTLRARKPDPAQDERRYHVAERSHGEYQRTLTVPAEVDAERIEATLKDGVLTLYLPKLPSKQPRQIAVSVST